VFESDVATEARQPWARQVGGFWQGQACGFPDARQPATTT
jgi:hypothetical protein